MIAKNFYQEESIQPTKRSQMKGTYKTMKNTNREPDAINHYMFDNVEHKQWIGREGSDKIKNAKARKMMD